MKMSVVKGLLYISIGLHHLATDGSEARPAITTTITFKNASEAYIQYRCVQQRKIGKEIQKLKPLKALVLPNTETQLLLHEDLAIMDFFHLQSLSKGKERKKKIGTIRIPAEFARTDLFFEIKEETICASYEGEDSEYVTLECKEISLEATSQPAVQAELVQPQPHTGQQQGQQEVQQQAQEQKKEKAAQEQAQKAAADAKKAQEQQASGDAEKKKAVEAQQKAQEKAMQEKKAAEQAKKSAANK